jgi:hypothetical protein
MKKQWIFAILLSVLFIGLISFGVIYDNVWVHDVKPNGNVVSQDRAIEGFDNVILDGVGDVNIHPGEEYKVVVTTNSNLQEKVITKVTGNTLYIDQERNFKEKNFNLEKITIDVYIPELKSVSVNGAGSLKINNGSASELEVSLFGLGSIDAQNFQVESINVMHSGAGEIKIWVTQTLKAELSGIGSIDAQKHPMENADVMHSGAGDIKIWVTQTLKAELSGIGDILYKGNPETDFNINGIGSIKIIN